MTLSPRPAGAPITVHCGGLDRFRKPGATVGPMLDLTSAHNWAAFAAMLLIVAWVLRQIGKRVAPVGTVVNASLGAAA